MDGEDKAFLIFMAIVGAVLVGIVAFSGGISSGGGPATESVRACAEIEDSEAATACFEAIGKDD